VRFVTRERINVDRVATAWAITRFVDSSATFEFVPRTRDLRSNDAIPFDIRGAELGHRGERCTLEALIDKYELRDQALRAMARIIRAAKGMVVCDALYAFCKRHKDAAADV
jgi:hypothetical protein